jgi:peptide/nickel transport system substrate-binding protein
MFPRICCLVLVLMWPPLVAAQSLVVGTKLQLNTLDPHLAYSYATGSSHELFYEALTRLGNDGGVEPSLATSWTQESPTIWDITLRPEVKFHDGSVLTVEDVIASLARIPRVAGNLGPFTVFTQGITSAEKVDTARLRITTKSPNSSLPYDLAHVMIVPRAIAQSASTADFDQGKAVIGTGPYTLGAWTKGDTLTAARFKAHWAGVPPWEQVAERVIVDDTKRLSALLAGQVDAIDFVPPAEATQLRQDQRFATSKNAVAAVHYLALDAARDVSPFVRNRDGSVPDRNPLKDVRVRKALSMAVNRIHIALRTMEGRAVPANQFTLPNAVGASKSIRPELFDLEAARALLRQAGWGGGFSVTLQTTNGLYPSDGTLAYTLAQMWSELGLIVIVDAAADQDYVKRANQREFSIISAQYGASDVSAMLRALLVTRNAELGTGTENRMYNSRPEIDTQLAEALATTEPKARGAKLEKVVEAYMADYVILPLYHPIVDFAMKKSLVVIPRTQRRFNALMIKPRD